MIINLTPHEINLVSHGENVTIPKGISVARVTNAKSSVKHIKYDGHSIPVVQLTGSKIIVRTGLSEEDWDNFVKFEEKLHGDCLFIVSHITRMYMSTHTDKVLTINSNLTGLISHEGAYMEMKE
tara:strand:- start:785 stop:1156 length:372 start_codon:yes stop_codon:yes gene_type:complete